MGSDFGMSKWMEERRGDDLAQQEHRAHLEWEQKTDRTWSAFRLTI
jgi:hypothetical protein